jgi:hypothetical protein
VRGTQIGVVNVASDVSGAQIGVVNVARRNDGLSFGILPLVGNGYNHVTSWASDVSLANVGFKLGTPHVYTLWGFGVTNGDRVRKETLLAVHFGVGAHVTPWDGPLFLDIDVVASSVDRSSELGENNDSQLGTLRLMVGWQLARHLAVVGGPTYNVQTSWNGTDRQPGFGVAEHVIHDGSTTVRMFPGFVLGLQI